MADNNALEKKNQISQATQDKAQDAMHQMMVKEMKNRIQDNISGGTNDMLRAIKQMINTDDNKK